MSPCHRTPSTASRLSARPPQALPPYRALNHPRLTPPLCAPRHAQVTLPEPVPPGDVLIDTYDTLQIRLGEVILPAAAWRWCYQDLMAMAGCTLSVGQVVARVQSIVSHLSGIGATAPQREAMTGALLPAFLRDSRQLCEAKKLLEGGPDAS